MPGLSNEVTVASLLSDVMVIMNTRITYYMYIINQIRTVDIRMAMLLVVTEKTGGMGVREDVCNI